MRFTDSGRLARRRVRDAGLAVSLWIVLAPPLAAQELFLFGAWTGVAELKFGVQQQESSTLAGNSSLFDRELTEERLLLRNSFTVVDRRFLLVNYGLTLGLLQSQLITEEQEGDGDGRLVAFDLSATFLPVSPRRFRLLVNRSVDDTPVEFAGTRELRSQSVSLATAAGPSWFPGDVTLRESEIRSTAEYGEFVRGLDQRRRTLAYTGTNRFDRHQLYAFFQLEDLADRVAPQFSHRSLAANLNHQFEVLAPDLATVTSIFRYFQRSGKLDSSSFYLDEVLRLRHRKSLSTSFRYVGQQLENFSGPPTRSQRGILGLHHRLYQSLETDLTAERTSSRSRAGTSSSDELGLNSTYRKNLPGSGRLTARLTSRYEMRDSLRGDGQELVTQERHVAHFGVPARLERPGVIPGSVVVTDELRTTIYDEGIDYELLEVAEFVEVVPLPGGQIRERDTLIVEYRVTAPRNKTSAVRNAFELSLDYGWVEPFWGYREVDRELLEGAFDALQDDQKDQFAGLRLRYNGRRLKLFSFNELQVRDSEIQSFESLRLADSVVYNPRHAWTLRLNLAHLSTVFTIPVRETTISEARLGLRWAPGPAWSLETYASGRVSLDTVAFDQTFERFGLQGRWKFGKITVLASLERWNRTRETDEVVIEEFQGLTASLRISRRFFPGRLSAPRRRPKPEPWPVDLPGLWSQPGPQNEPGDGAEPTAEAAQESGGTRPL